MGCGVGVVSAGSEVGLVGRVVELGVLRAVVAGAVGGRAGLAVVEGEAGIGKSRLIDETLMFARGEGFRVLRGTGDEVEQDRPLRALREALEVERAASGPRQAALVRLLDAAAGADRVGSSAGTVDEGWLIVEAVVDVLEELASLTPVALVVEDLQWGDALTLRALHSIARHLTRVPLALLVTVRGGSHRADVDRAIADLVARGAEHVLVEPLSAAEAAYLAGEVAGRPAGPRLLEQVGGAGGNPLFVIELVRALGDEGAIEVEGGRAEAHPASLPPSLRLTLLRRVSLLPEDALNLLRVASVLGGAFSLVELGLLAERSPARLVPALAAAVDAGLLIDSGDRLAFRHDLLREAIYQDLPMAVRKGLHRQAGVVLGRAGVPVERLAGHVVLGAESGDAEAVGWLRRAAQVAAGRAPATTVRLLERAVEISVPGDSIADEVSAELVAPLLATGRRSDAEKVARGALARDLDAGVEVMVRTSLASVLSMGARYPEAIDQLQRAAVVAPVSQRDQLAASGSLLMVLAGQLGSARDGAERAVETGERVGDDHTLCLGLQTLAMVALAEGFVDRAVSMAQRAVIVAEDGDAAWANRLVPQLWLGTALADGDRLDEAEVVLQAGRSSAEQAGDVARLPLYHWAIAETRVAGGQWDDAVAEAQAGLSLIEENANHVGDVFAHAICAHVALHRGDRVLAQSALDEARRSLVAGPVEIGFDWMSWIAALLLEVQDQPAEALATLAETWDLCAPVRYLQASSRAMGPDLVRMALSAGDRGCALSVTEELERSARRSPTPTTRGLALRCRGLLDNDPEALLEAVAAHRGGPRPYLLAAACEDAALILGRTASAGGAGRLLDEAIAVYGRLEAAWDVARAQSTQRALGIRPVRHALRRPSFGWESLTPTELRVVGLVAGGLTNRQIAERLYVSRRTVATHIEHVFQKLGHSNRVGLAADAVRQGIKVEATPTARRAPAAAPTSPRRQPPVPPHD
jgi:DNA-binding CsgD family transcriptional regulator/tetratricopeptide (TPR) repeat protein